MSKNAFPIGEALRSLRTREGLTQTAVGKLPDSVASRSLSHWENGRTTPSLQNVAVFLRALDLDFHDLQDALDEVSQHPSALRTRIDEITAQVDRLKVLHGVRITAIERRLAEVERRQVEQPAQHFTERNKDA